MIQRTMMSGVLNKCLQDQGLTYKGGEIFKCQWYLCVEDYHGYKKGRLYSTNEYGDLCSDDDGVGTLSIENPYFNRWFHKATVDEILKINGM